jgi:hypothetical protein
MSRIPPVSSRRWSSHETFTSMGADGFAAAPAASCWPAARPSSRSQLDHVLPSNPDTVPPR